jgi:hypothetical protein
MALKLIAQLGVDGAWISAAWHAEQLEQAADMVLARAR